MRVTMPRVFGIAAAAVIAGAAMLAWRPSSEVGYVEIKTVPSTSAPQSALYLDSIKLAPLRKGSTILRQPVGTLRLQTEGFAGFSPLCEIVVRRDRITTVTLSVLERPPRCQCRYTSTDAATPRACVS
jgi:hypothetical protein